MRRILLCLVLPSLACKASSSGSQDVVLVNVDAPNLDGITRLNVTFTNAGTSETRSYPANATSTPIVFPTALSATLPTSRTGKIDVSIDGLNVQNQKIATGQASKDLVANGQTDLPVSLAAFHPGTGGTGGQGGTTATGGGMTGAGGGTDLAGSGGRGGTGGAVSAAGAESTGSSESLMPGFTVDDGGYVTAGPWHGWAWAASEKPYLGTTITPQPSDQGGTGFGAVTAGSPLCISGTVVQDPNYGSVALLGFAIQQDKTPAYTPSNTWKPTGTGVRWQVKNTGGSPLRLQIQGVASYPSQSWCYPLVGNSGTIKWSDFNSQCWGSSTTVAYDGTIPLNQIIVQVSGLNYAAQPFDFCLEGAAPY